MNEINSKFQLSDEYNRLYDSDCSQIFVRITHSGPILDLLRLFLLVPVKTPQQPLQVKLSKKKSQYLAGVCSPPTTSNFLYFLYISLMQTNGSFLHLTTESAVPSSFISSFFKCFTPSTLSHKKPSHYEQTISTQFEELQISFSF